MTLEANIGNGHAGYYSVRGDETGLVYEAPHDEPVQLHPPKQAWEAFWAAVAAADVWAWRPDYEADHDVCDGDYWACAWSTTAASWRRLGARDA